MAAAKGFKRDIFDNAIIVTIKGRMAVIELPDALAQAIDDALSSGNVAKLTADRIQQKLNELTGVNVPNPRVKLLDMGSKAESNGTSWIPVNSSMGPQGSDLLAFVDAGKQQRARGDLLVANMNAMINGTDYTELEKNYGLKAGDGDDIWFAVANTVQTELPAAANLQFLNDSVGVTNQDPAAP